jgi:5-(carboxyamino)imidazole ribonucleotide synthase
MLNWIGELPDWAAHCSMPQLAWHDYGKSPRAGRKVGHATLCAPDLARLGDALQQLQQIAPSRPLALALAALAA